MSPPLWGGPQTRENKKNKIQKHKSVSRETGGGENSTTICDLDISLTRQAFHIARSTKSTNTTAPNRKKVLQRHDYSSRPNTKKLFRTEIFPSSRPQTEYKRDHPKTKLKQ